ncbi:MAG: hypothetical protein AAGK78_05785, partial [Planctomycetota bacterium]
GVLLRAAIAAKQDGDESRSAAWTNELADRFEAIRRRGDLPHGRYESRFYLDLRSDPPRALELAEENWAQQKEYRDTRNLLEAALAAGSPDGAQAAVEFLRNTGNEDVRLQALSRQVVAAVEKSEAKDAG